MIEGTHLLGIRHHGPGSARSVLAALEAIEPEVILLEGPPDAQEILSLAGKEEMNPPVALLVYRPDKPTQAVFYPFAEFSPEWQAIRFGLVRNIPVQFMDLPQRHRLAIEAPDKPEEEPDETEAEVETEDDSDEVIAVAVDEDPFALIAEATGASDSERWWEEQFEKRYEGPDVFKAVLELMTALRDEKKAPLKPLEAQREAWMRQTLREATKQGYSRIAVVLGAWHAPALANMPTAKSDAEVLKGLPKCNVAVTWMPWNHRRLTMATGYGAGIHSPGYYHHLWRSSHHKDISMQWMTRVAHLLRAEDLEGSTASIIEATRLAETTAALRARALPGLTEFNEAAQAVFCFGDAAAMRLISEKLIVGDVLGSVPPDAPQVPLQRDLQKEQKRLRLPPEALDKTLELDLRKPNDLDRSRLLHRLRLLKVNWGTTGYTRGKGTFKEAWRLRWEPELEVALIDAARWGNTIEQAASAYTIHQADHSQSLLDVTRLVEIMLLADLPATVEPVMRRLENQAAVTSDVSHLIEALPPLVNVMRYGNVRQTDASMVGQIVDSLVTRICIGLPPACSSLNDEAATEMLGRINSTDSALATLAVDTLRQLWSDTLKKLSDDDTLHGLIQGRSVRLLLEQNVRTAEDSGLQFSRALSRAVSPSHAAAWIEGFLTGSGLVLLHQPVLWGVIDSWLCSLTPEHFTDVLPLLRRTFTSFPGPERRQMGELARQGPLTVKLSRTVDQELDETRARKALPTLTALLGKSTFGKSP